MNKEHVLLICTDAFHLGWMGATRRIFHLETAFCQLGFKVALLAGRTTNPKIQNEIDEAFPGVVIRTHHTGDYPLILDTSPITRRVWRAGWKLRGESYYWSKLHWGWADKIDIHWLRKVLYQHDIRTALIWGVCVGYLEGAVLAQRMAKLFGVPWVFELQDPPRCAGLGPDNYAIVGRFRQLLQDASRVIVVAQSYGKDISDRFGGSVDKKLYTVHLSYEGEPSLQKVAKGAACTIMYAGSLGGGRSIKPLLEAFVNVISERSDFAATFNICLAGSGQGFEDALVFAEANNISNQLSFLGVLSPDAVNRTLGVSHALIIVQPNECDRQVPGKIFESLKTGKPIIGLMPKDCEAADILRSSGLGIIHEANDNEGLRDSLIRLWDAWRIGESVVSPNWAVIEDFSLSRLPVKIKRVIEGFVDMTDTIGSG